MQLFSADAKLFYFDHKKLKKPPPKVAYLWQLGGFFSVDSTAQNNPELHFHFINSFIQPSRVGSLFVTYVLIHSMV